MTAALPPHLRPAATGSAAAFFRAAAHRELRLPRCLRCATYAWPPAGRCRTCGSDAIDWVRASGRGVVHTFTIVRRSPEPYFQAKVPYVVAMIELEEGPRLLSALVDCAIESVRADMDVVVAFVEAAEGVVLPVFTPARAADHSTAART